MGERGDRPRLGGAILAGGRARRLGGIDKGALRDPGGATIIERLIERLVAAGIDEIVIVGDPARHAACGREVIADLRPGMGPLGGIEAALAHFTGAAEAVVFLPCDMPAATAEVIGHLMDVFAAGDSPVVCAETGDFFWHPLCAVVHNGIMSQVSDAIDRGRRSVQELWRRLGAAAVHFEDETAFFNVNTPADVDSWLGAPGAAADSERSDTVRRGNAMGTKVDVEDSIATGLGQFVAAEGIGIELVGDGSGQVKILPCQDRRQSDLDTLYADGWIPCTTAWGMAKRLGIPLADMGKMLDHLHVKVRQCALGCFP